VVQDAVVAVRERVVRALEEQVVDRGEQEVDGQLGVWRDVGQLEHRGAGGGCLADRPVRRIAPPVLLGEEAEELVRERVPPSVVDGATISKDVRREPFETVVRAPRTPAKAAETVSGVGAIG